MTWGELKQRLEAQGVCDGDPMCWMTIEYEGHGLHAVHEVMHPELREWCIDDTDSGVHHRAWEDADVSS